MSKQKTIKVVKVPAGKQAFVKEISIFILLLFANILNVIIKLPESKMILNLY